MNFGNFGFYQIIGSITFQISIYSTYQYSVRELNNKARQLL